MLVRLYALPPLAPAIESCAREGVTVRRAIAPEKPAVLAFVREHFASSRSEVDAAFAHTPVRCFVAARAGAVVGFACHDVTYRNFFGPEGVAAVERGRGIGQALLLATLHAQHAMGYAYAIIGGVGPASFYRKIVDAVDIVDSTPGIYAGRLGG